MTIHNIVSKTLIMLTISAYAQETQPSTTQAQQFNTLALNLARQSKTIAADTLNGSIKLLELKAENSMPAPEIEGAYMWGENETQNKWSLSISQSIDWPGVYAARNKEIRSESTVITYERRQALIAKALEVKLAMIDIIAASKNLHLSNMLSDTIQALYQATAKAVDNGAATILDLNKLEIERMAINKQYTADTVAYVAAVTSLNAIVGRDITHIIPVLNEYPQEPMMSLSHYESLFNANSPEIAAARQRTLSAELALKKTSLMSLPGFTIGYNYENEGLERWHGLSLAVSIPFLSNRTAKQTAKARKLAAKINAEQITIEQYASIAADYSTAKTADDECRRYSKIFDKNDNVLLLRKAYDNNQITLLNYLTELNYFISAQRDYLEAQYRKASSLARLNRLSLL